MQLYQLRAKTRLKRGKRIGRGGKRGTTSGRGTKGQKARAGAKIRPAIRDMIKKLPKLRGYRFHSFRPRAATVDLAAIAARFPAGATVDPAALLGAGLIRRMKRGLPAVKVVGNGSPQKALRFQGVALSAPARAAVETAGGSVR